MGCSPCGLSTSCISSSSLCGAGTTAINGGANWGSGIGCGLNQMPSTTSNPNPPVQIMTLSGSGISYTLSTFPLGGDLVYLIVDHNGTDYYCPVTSVSGTCKWSQFNTAPWFTTGVPLAGSPVATHIEFQLSAAAVVESWSFCVTALSIAP